MVFTSTSYRIVTTKASKAEFLHPKINPTDSSRGASDGQNILNTPWAPINKNSRGGEVAHGPRCHSLIGEDSIVA